MLYTTLRQLEYIVAVAGAESLTGAAQILHVSQPALSVAISRVEERQGQKLFVRRKGAPMSLTDFGRAFCADANALLAQARRLEDPATRAGRKLERIVFGCFEDIAPTHLAPALGHLRRAFPRLEIEPRVAGFEALARDMLAGQITLSLTYDLGLDAGFSRQVFSDVTPHAFLPPDDPLAGQGALRLADLTARPLVLVDQGLSIRHILGLFRERGLLPRISHRAASLEVMRSLAANGEGVGISYTRPPVQVSYDGRPLIALPLSDPGLSEPVVLAHASPGALMNPLPEVIASLMGLATAGA